VALSSLSRHSTPCDRSMTPHLHVRQGNPSFLDLDWDRPISGWEEPRLVEMPTGVHRHPIVFVSYEEGVYAIKELPVRYAQREFDALHALSKRTVNSARPAGLVKREWLDPHSEASGAVITRYVTHAFPYRELVSGSGFGHRRSQVLDALAGLLVELHLAGCYWGDCSLSNALYRYDAGAIEAIMIDAETAELHESLSDGQREQDLEVMIENLAGDMGDLAGEIENADLVFGLDVAARYRQLWDELSEDLVIRASEGYLIRERIARLNDLGFSVDDVDLTPTEKGNLVRVKARVGGRAFHSDRLRELVGVEASENQARQMLSDINYYLGKHGEDTASGKVVRMVEWRLGVLEPMIERIAEVWHGDDPVQGYCDFLNHRMALASARGADVPNDEAFADWGEHGYPGFEPGRPPQGFSEGG